MVAICRSKTCEHYTLWNDRIKELDVGNMENIKLGKIEVKREINRYEVSKMLHKIEK